MLRRIRELFNDVLRQADLLLLALCGGASLFGVLMVSSATRYMHTNRLVLVQAAALVNEHEGSQARLLKYESILLLVLRPVHLRRLLSLLQ